MRSQGFIEPPPGLFGEEPPQGGGRGEPAHAASGVSPDAATTVTPGPAAASTGVAPRPAAPRLTIRADAQAPALPVLPRLAPVAQNSAPVTQHSVLSMASPASAELPDGSPSAASPVAVPQTAAAAEDHAVRPSSSSRSAWPIGPATDLREPDLPALPRLAPAPPAAAVATPAAPVPPSGPAHPTVAGEAPASPTGVASPASPASPADRSLPEWSLVLADGVAVPLYGPVIVGRKPSGDRFPGATLAAVPDTTRTMSKTHARFYLDEGVPMVDDLGSTNGIALFPGGNTQGAMAVEPGAPAEVRSGDVVQLGEYEIGVQRN